MEKTQTEPTTEISIPPEEKTSNYIEVNDSCNDVLTSERSTLCLHCLLYMSPATRCNILRRRKPKFYILCAVGLKDLFSSTKCQFLRSVLSRNSLEVWSGALRTEASESLRWTQLLQHLSSLLRAVTATDKRYSSVCTTNRTKFLGQLKILQLSLQIIVLSIDANSY